MEKLVVIPTYNEKENIASIIEAIHKLDKNFHVLVVDDNSPDGTASIVQSLQKTKYPDSLFLEVRTNKQGLGTAYIHGFKWALDKGYQYIFEMDADFSHNPADLERLYEAAKNKPTSVAVGSRYVSGGKVENWPTNRIMLSKGASLYTQLITFMPVKDPTSGFVCYDASALRSIDLDTIHFVGYAFQIEMKFAAWKLGFPIQEVPITFKDRTLGKSKMNKSIIKEGIWGVIKLRLAGFNKKYRRNNKKASQKIRT